MHTGVYPGTFDPVTNGHMDIIQRATRVVDRLIVAVAENDGKAPMFSREERLAMLRADVATIKPYKGSVIEVTSFDALLVDFACSVEANVVIRGLRAVSDFEFEFQMAGMNARLKPQLETVFLMASERQHFISSRFVKEIARLGGDVSAFVSPAVHKHLQERFHKPERKAAGAR